jgi:hypothetical protein
MLKVLDTCYVRYKIKQKDYLKIRNASILPFQLKELNEQELKIFFLLGGNTLKLPSKLKGDLNFFTLKKNMYCIYTYDKALKKQLKKNGYRVY